MFSTLSRSRPATGSPRRGGFIEHNPGGKPFITQVLAQDGQIAGVYRKVHVAPDEEPWFAPGGATPVFRLRLPGGPLPCALAVCADSDRPDLFAAFAQQGARIVFHSSAPGLYSRRTDAAAWQAGFAWYRDYLFARLPVWARDNGLWIAAATQTGATVDEDFPGGSFVFAPDGTCVAATSDGAETLLVHDVEIAADQ
ncbi:MAG TPA: carbon-nitrogen hydrolase family protein [Chloroflexia bacterium]|nr:carbon-nitrogen hydrolase family protein [Chloroflexia bacterium]